jgi:hypothetical protein
MDYVDDALVEMLWKDLDGQVSRQQIARAVTQGAARFERATVTAFVPIFIRRQVLEHKSATASTRAIQQPTVPPRG